MQNDKKHHAKWRENQSNLRGLLKTMHADFHVHSIAPSNPDPGDNTQYITGDYI